MPANVKNTTAAILSKERRRLVHVVYIIVALYALAMSLYGLRRITRQIGQPFGGFLWGWDPSTQLYTAAPYTPWNWPGPAHGLERDDRILAVNGRPPDEFPDVYRTQAVGDIIAYRVIHEWEERPVTIEVPLARFTANQAFEFYGVFFLIGVSALGSGYILLRQADNVPTILAAFVLLAMACVALYTSHEGGIRNRPHNRFAVLTLFTPSYPFAAALLVHFFLIFPGRLSLLDGRPWLVWAPYAGAIGLIGYTAIASHVGGYWNTVAFALWLSSVLIAGILVTARSLWAYVHRRRQQRFTAVAPLGIALMIGVALALGAGIIPFLGLGPPALLTHLFLPLAVIYPVVLVYAVRNARLVRRLERQLARVRQLEAEARELRNVREQTLHEIADTLHDTIIPDVKGLQLWLAGIARRSRAPDHDDFEFLEGALSDVYQTTRAIMEDAKPVDFSAKGLLPATEQQLRTFRRTTPGLDVELIAESFDEAFPPAIKRELYRIIQAALANSREHAGAETVTVRLRKNETQVSLVVEDDGQGFDVEQALADNTEGERRRLGLRNMQMRARRIGGELSIASGPRGTRVELSVPLSSDRG